jgi:hypothetical protein
VVARVRLLQHAQTGVGEPATIYDNVRGNGGESGLSAVVTGIFTIAGVAVTAAAALLATWIKYKTDRRQELRKERRELYARFQQASAHMWDALSRVRPVEDNGAAASSEDAARAVNESWIAWAKIWMEMSIAASDEVWRITEPLFEEFRSAYFHSRLPSEDHEDALRQQMRRELGR